MKIFYIDNYTRILSYELLESNYDVNKYTIDSMINHKLVVEKDQHLMESIHVLLSSKNDPYYIDSIHNGAEWYINLSIQDIRNYIINHKNAPLTNELINDVVPKLPSTFFIDLYNKDILSHKYKSNIPIIDPTYELYKDDRCSVYFIDDLNVLDKEIYTSEYYKGFTNYEVRKLYNLTCRLFVPYYYVDIINNMGLNKYIIYTSPLLDEDGNVLFDGNLIYGLPQNLVKTSKDMFSSQNNIYKYSKNTKLLSMNSLYRVIISANLNDWSSIITVLAKEEQGYRNPVISSMYYYLLNYINIRSHLKVNEQLILKNITVK